MQFCINPWMVTSGNLNAYNLEPLRDPTMHFGDFSWKWPVKWCENDIHIAWRFSNMVSENESKLQIAISQEPFIWNIPMAWVGFSEMLLQLNRHIGL
jgi:hypothetical protein